MTRDPISKDDDIIDLDAEQVIENTDVPPKAPAAKAKPRVRPLVYVLAALGVGAVAGGWIYKDFLSNYFPSDQTRALTEKITALESHDGALREQLTAVDKLTAQLKNDLDELEAKNTTLTGLAEAGQKSDVTTAEKLNQLALALNETKQAVADIASRPAVVSGTAPTHADTTVLADLEKRVVELEKDVVSIKTTDLKTTDTTALSQSLSDLKAKISAGTGYREELGRIQSMVPAAAGLDVLQQNAALGIPDVPALAAELKLSIAVLPKSTPLAPAPADQSWWDSVVDSMSDIVVIRTEGDVDWAKSAAAVVVLVEAGNLPQAIELLKATPGEMPVPLQQWLQRAEARLSTNTALQAVEDAVLRVIAAKG
jgi:hypothetical protein